MLNRNMLLIEVLIMLLLFMTPLLAESEVILGEIKKSLTCLCECNMTVEACQGAMACDSAENLTREAKQLIDRNMDQKEVLASFVTRYGERILAAPSKRGFNLTAWIFPFAVIIVTGFGIISALRKWVRSPEEKSTISGTNTVEATDLEYEEELEEVLRDFSN